jgi:hypothetical protein
VLPDFIVIGVYKAGTTSLHHYFDQHPDVFMTHVKEPNFFAFDDKNPVHVAEKSGRFRVRSLTQYEFLFRGASAGQSKGEVSPSYFRSETAAIRIHEAIPDCRLIVSLRDPVDRAYSAYQMAYRHGGTKERFERIDPWEAPWLRNSLYAKGVRRYMDLFGRSGISVVLFEDIKERPQSLMQSLFRFVGVNPEFSVDVSRRFNPGGMPKWQGLYRLSEFLRRTPGVLELTPKVLRRAMANARDKTLKRARPLEPAVRAKWLECVKGDILETQEILQMDLSRWLAVQS